MNPVSHKEVLVLLLCSSVVFPQDESAAKGEVKVVSHQVLRQPLADNTAFPVCTDLQAVK